MRVGIIHHNVRGLIIDLYTVGIPGMEYLHGLVGGKSHQFTIRMPERIYQGTDCGIGLGI